MANEKKKRSTSPSCSTSKERKKIKVTERMPESRFNKMLCFIKQIPSSDPAKIIDVVNKVSSVKEATQQNISKEDTDDFIHNNKGTNIVRVFNQLQWGFRKSFALQKIAEDYYIRDIKRFQRCEDVQLTDVQITAMHSHPSTPQLFAVGGKFGTLLLYSLQSGQISFLGTGPRASIEAIRFNGRSSGVEVCSASVDGTVKNYDFNQNKKNTLVSSEMPNREWFCSVDVHSDGKSVYAGDNIGGLAMHHLDSGETIYKRYEKKLHAFTIKHVEFNPRDPNVMVTASLDKSVKVWDIRKISDGRSYVQCLQHDNDVSAASFSLTDGCKLLTTVEDGQLSVFNAPMWTLEHKIQHAHQQSRHLATIRASWHPKADVFVIGRYSDPKVPIFEENARSVDVFCASSGLLRHELVDNRLITSLCQFDCSGSILASSSGRTVHLWAPRK